jgi:SAM-dependent methyltransferase
VGDLASGTGITTRAILARLGPEGRVIGIDPSQRIVERARALVSDPRALFRVATAEALIYESMENGPLARVVCNSGIWLAADIKREIGRVRGSLADDGVFAFSMPAAFLGHAEHLTTPEVTELSRVVDEVRRELAFDFGGVQSTPVDLSLGSVDNMRESLENAAYSDVDFQLWDFRWPASEYLDWMEMPVIRNGMVPADRKADSQRMIELLRERLDPDLEFRNPYYMIVARAFSGSSS